MIKKKLAIMFILMLITSIVFAGIGVSPTVLETKLKPGKSKKGYFVVRSDFSEKVKVIIQPEEYWSRETGKKGLPVEQWLKIKPKEFIMYPHSVRRIKYRLTLPKDADSENMAEVFFAAKNPGEGTIGIVTRFGVALYLIPEGKEEISAKINKISSGWRAKEKNQFQFTINVENLGNVHLRPSGKVEVKDEKDQKIAELTIDSGWPVFPGRKYNYNAIGEIKDPNLLPGKYQATVFLDCGAMFGYKDKIYQQQVEFTIDQNGEVVR